MCLFSSLVPSLSSLWGFQFNIGLSSIRPSWRKVHVFLLLWCCLCLLCGGCQFSLNRSGVINLTLAFGIAGSGPNPLRLCRLFQRNCCGVISSTGVLTLGGSFGGTFLGWHWWGVRVCWCFSASVRQVVSRGTRVRAMLSANTMQSLET